MNLKKWLFLSVLVLVGAVMAGGAVLAQGTTGPGLIVYASDRTGNFEIYILNPDTGQTTQLTNDPATDIEPAWSPDGNTVAFVSDRDGDYELYVVRADGTNMLQLTNNTAEDRLPRWQPDGLHLMYSSDVNGQWDLYAISADGALVRQLTNDPSDERGPASVGDAATGLLPVFTQAPLATITPQATNTPSLPDATVANSTINVRQNPGTGAAIVTSLTRGTQLGVVGRYPDNSWLQVRLPDNRLGWVYASLLTVNVDLTQVPVVNAVYIDEPTPVPTDTPIPVDPVSISFTTTSETITAGECVTISWAVSGIDSVYYQDQGVVGTSERQECPGATKTYHLRVLRRDGVWVDRYITITVNP